MTSPSPKNLLLRALSREDYSLLEPSLQAVTLQTHEPLYEHDRPIEQVYFLEDGVASIVSKQENGRLIEVGIHGCDGMSGIPVVLGAEQSPHPSMIQVGDAPAQRIASERLLDACSKSVELNRTLLRYAYAFSIQASLTAAANAEYALTERCARWLLMCHDRLSTDRIELTHEFLSMMLAVRRSGVTVTLQTLEETGAIKTSRGIVMVVDRQKLEGIAGEAYGQPEAEYRRLIGPFGKSAKWPRVAGLETPSGD